MRSKALLQFSFLCLFLPALAFAQDASVVETAGQEAKMEAKEDEPDKVSTGVIASSAGKAQQGGVSVETGAASPGDESSAISGSVSSSGRKCSAKLINSSEKTAYKIRYQVIGKNERGNEAMKKSCSARIRPQQTIDKEFSCRRGLSMSLNLRSATPLNSK